MHHRNIILEGIVCCDYGAVMQLVSDSAGKFMVFISMDGKTAHMKVPGAK